MRTDDLINQLSSDLKAVRAQISPLRFAAAFSLVCFIAIGLGLILVQVRSDWGTKISDIPFVWDLLSSLGLMVSSIVVVGWLSSPGRGRGTLGLMTMLAFAAAILVFAVWRSIALSGSDVSAGTDLAGMKCFLTVLGFALIPALAIGLATRMRAAIRTRLTGGVISLASIGAGTLAITLHCNVDNGLHIALWHFALPIALGIAGGITVGAKSLKW